MELLFIILALIITDVAAMQSIFYLINFIKNIKYMSIYIINFIKHMILYKDKTK